MSKFVLSATFVRPIFVGLLMLSAIPARSVSPPAPYKISGIKAMLFYDGKGTFSRDVLAKPDFSFWNTSLEKAMQKGHRIQPWSWSKSRETLRGMKRRLHGRSSSPPSPQGRLF